VRARWAFDPTSQGPWSRLADLYARSGAAEGPAQQMLSALTSGVGVPVTVGSTCREPASGATVAGPQVGRAASGFAGTSSTGSRRSRVSIDAPFSVGGCPSPDITLGIGAPSCCGQLSFTAVADRDGSSELPVFLVGLRRVLTNLTHAAPASRDAPAGGSIGDFERDQGAPDQGRLSLHPTQRRTAVLCPRTDTRRQPTEESRHEA
jgi:hypothetical protein